jgi:glycosyltransferase involved in cell wall biosynthesis
MNSLANKHRQNPKISIILRTKNEEKWLKACINSIRSQTWKNYELVLVDNGSIDATVEVARALNVDKIEFISQYKPGAALNVGISASDGDICVFISAHCVAADRYWLEQLVSPIVCGEVLAVYGRQIPTSRTNPDNSRDLLMTFGGESFEQSLDIKFHNANSAIDKSILDANPFDNNISNVEDWIWSEKLLSLGFKIKYQSTARVFHHHGINQHDDYKESFRASNVSKILYKLYHPEAIEEPFFCHKNWKTLIILSKPNKIDQMSIISRYSEYDIVAVNSEESPDNFSFLSIKIDRNLGFLDYLKKVLTLAEEHHNTLYDSVSFVDFSYPNINLDYVEGNLAHLYSTWSDICSVGRQIFGKTHYIDNRDNIRFRENIFPSKKTESKMVELVIGYCSAMRACAIRTGDRNHLDYYITGLLNHYSTLKVEN